MRVGHGIIRARQGTAAVRLRAESDAIALARVPVFPKPFVWRRDPPPRIHGSFQCSRVQATRQWWRYRLRIGAGAWRSRGDHVRSNPFGEEAWAVGAGTLDRLLKEMMEAVRRHYRSSDGGKSQRSRR